MNIQIFTLLVWSLNVVAQKRFWGDQKRASYLQGASQTEADTAVKGSASKHKKWQVVNVVSR